LFLKICLFFFILSQSLHLHAEERKLIINKLLEINNFTFDFEQRTGTKNEKGTCFVVFDNKLKCNYADKKQKEIIINNKTLVVIQKRYNKVYFYPITKSPFVKILNKNSLINLIRQSKVKIKDKIHLVYLDDKKKEITVFFSKKNYELIGWQIKDDLQNKIYFSLKIKNTNIEIDDGLFKIPSVN